MKSKMWIRIFFLSLISLSVTFGIKRNSGTFLIPFEHLLGITRGDSSFLIAVWMVTIAFGILVFGQLIQYIKCNILFLMSMLTIAFGFFMTSFAHSYMDLLIWFSIVSGFGFGAPLMLIFVTSMYEGYEQKGLLTGLALSIQIAGAAAFLFGMSWLIKVVNLSGTFIVLSILAVLGGIVGYFIASKEKSKKVGFKFDRRLITFYITVSIGIGIYQMQMVHRLPLFKEVGMSLGWLGILALIDLWVNSGTEFIAGWFFIDKLKNSIFCWRVAVIALIFGNLMLIALSKGLVSFSVYAVFFGMIAMMPALIIPMANYLAEYNKEDFAPLISTTQFFQNISMALFGWLGGVFYYWTGSYELILIITSIILLICVFTLRK